MEKTTFLVLCLYFTCASNVEGERWPIFVTKPFLPAGLCHDHAIMQQAPKPQEDKTSPARVDYVVKPSCFEHMIRATEAKQGFTKIYTAYFGEVDWHQAKENCKADKKRIATIQSDKENNILQNYLLRQGLINKEFWIGGSCLKKYNVYKWAIDGQQKDIKYSHWAIHQPNDKDKSKQCVQISKNDFLWENINCSAKRFYLCESLPAYTPDQD